MKRLKPWLSNKKWFAKYKFAKSRYERAIPNRYFLPEDEFDKFVTKYGALDARPFQDYSLEGMEARARERCGLLSTLAPRMENVRALEIGASDGLVLKEILASGATEAIAVDVVDQLHSKAKDAGVQLALNSAEDLSIFDTESFDLIYSWGSLEHIPNVEKAVHECIRLLAPGGLLYLEAGPLYYSPWGYHYYSTLRIPYIQILFPEEVLHEYAKEQRGDIYRNYLPWTNGRPSSDYTGLVSGLPPDMTVASFWHGYDWFSSAMIARYPAVFRAKGVDFRDFFVDVVRISLKKTLCS